MGYKYDLTGNTYSRLTVIGYSHAVKRVNYWLCKCICGKEISVSGTNLKTGNTKSCGCIIGESTKYRKDLTGKKFGKLMVKSFSPGKGKYEYFWKCKCDCGNIVRVKRDNLTSGNSKSCGCMLRLGYPTHGMTQHILYSKWCSMHQRCSNPKEDNFYLYGGRGIKVCKRWHKFENFRDDMFGSWEDGFTLERIDHNGDYSPENCRWATIKEQARNKRNNRVIEFNGQSKCVSEWAEEYNIKPYTLFSRIYRLGWSFKKALLTPIHKR